MERLVEETETHILVGLLLLLLLLLLGLLLGSGSTTGGGATGSSGTGTARGNGSELLRASGDQLEADRQFHVSASRYFISIESKTYLVDVLARELGEELLETLILGLDADGAEDGLDVLGRGGGVAAEGEEEVGCEVLHFEGSARKGVVSIGVREIFSDS